MNSSSHAALRLKATFGAGCFWGVEDAFRRQPGVVETEVGYSGGDTLNPTYEQVCSGKTNHAEVVLVHFEPSRTSYEHLLSIFWSIHDPTQLNRQGADIGTQYRSMILTHGMDQDRLARASREAWAASGHYARIVTEIMPAGHFWRAEDYHQGYLERRRWRP